MDNFFTPKKIQRLISLAEDNGGNLKLVEDDLNQIATLAKSSIVYESSSGILDLDRLEGFGETEMGNLSLSKSSTFNPGEMTGRSTGAEQVPSGPGVASHPEDSGRHSLAVGSIASKMNKQTYEINDIMRHSIATNYSFHSKRDLTADEESLIAREAPLPCQQTEANITDCPSITNSNISMGTYFKNRCPDIGNILHNTDSPNRSPSMMPSITEVTPVRALEIQKDTSQVISVDDSLDSIPVKQPRSIVPEKTPEKKNQAAKPDKLFKKPKQPVFESETQKGTKKMEASKVPVKKCSMKAGPSHKSFMTSSKPADVLIKNIHSSFRPATDDTEGEENSFSISKIADYLRKQSEVSITEIMQLNKKKSPRKSPKGSPKKQPLTEVTNSRVLKAEAAVKVTNLADSRKAETASSAGTVKTVVTITPDMLPKLVYTQPSPDDAPDEEPMKTHATRSKSPSSKSTSSTVRDNFASFKSGDSPINSNQGEGNRTKVPSPNVAYKELDKSVDWQEVLLQKSVKRLSLATEDWVGIVATPVSGYVGISCPVTIRVTTLTDSWLTAKFDFDNLPNEGKDLNVELPRLPLLLAPGKCEHFKLHISSNVEMKTTFPFTITLNNTSVDGDVTQKGNLEVDLKLPVIQAMTPSGMNRVIFPTISEQTSCTKCFVLISDCYANLQLELSIIEGESLFAIQSVQEIMRTDVKTVLMARSGASEEQTVEKAKAANKQLCRLTIGYAIKVIVAFKAPKLSDLQLKQGASFIGVLNVNLIGLSTVLRKVDLVGAVGFTNLVTNVPNNQLQLTNAPTSVVVTNSGSAKGTWKILSNESTSLLKMQPTEFELPAGDSLTVSISFIGSQNKHTEFTLAFEDIANGKLTTIEVSAGISTPQRFPLKTSHRALSWVRAGRKEISLINTEEKKLFVRCLIVGEGFIVDLPGVESRGNCCFSFNPHERRHIPILFTPNSNMPFTATLHLVYEKNADFSRKIKLFGCASGEHVRWSGLATYGETALVRAVSRAPVDLRLHNRATGPAFVCARVHFNLQYMAVEETSQLVGARSVVPARAHHTVTLRVDWARVERSARDVSATTLASVTVLTGAELTRRRILRILRHGSATDDLDTSLLPEHLRGLVDEFEGESDSMNDFLTDFHETQACLTELFSGLHELTAQIDLPQDFGDGNNTVFIADDTVIEHHTLCE